MSNNKADKLVEAVRNSLHSATFIKLTLGNPKSAPVDLQKIVVRPVTIKKRQQLSFVYRYKTRDVTKNYELPEGVEKIGELLGGEFHSGHLFTAEHDYQFELNKRGEARFNVGAPTLKVQLEPQHNRHKNTQISQNNLYLRLLDVTDDKGAVRPTQTDKWRQINKFVEIVGGLYDESNLTDKPRISIVDMGSGKGYLTFAVYDYFNNPRGIKADVTGVETREHLVNVCNDAARQSEFENLKFEIGLIENYPVRNADILIALHACNTATDDAIYKGIRAAASLIICSPCCHQQIRPQIKPPAIFKNILKHGILLEREAETLTDGLRALLLERSGYATKVFEFISVEHTAKNNLIVGVKHEKAVDVAGINRQIQEIKDFYGIRTHRLEDSLRL